MIKLIFIFIEHGVKRFESSRTIPSARISPQRHLLLEKGSSSAEGAKWRWEALGTGLKSWPIRSLIAMVELTEFCQQLTEFCQQEGEKA